MWTYVNLQVYTHHQITRLWFEGGCLCSKSSSSNLLTIHAEEWHEDWKKTKIVSAWIKNTVQVQQPPALLCSSNIHAGFTNLSEILRDKNAQLPVDLNRERILPWIDSVQVLCPTLSILWLNVLHVVGVGDHRAVTITIACRPERMDIRMPIRRRVLVVRSPIPRRVLAVRSPIRRRVLAVRSPKRRRVLAVRSPVFRGSSVRWSVLQVIGPVKITGSQVVRDWGVRSSRQEVRVPLHLLGLLQSSQWIHKPTDSHSMPLPIDDHSTNSAKLEHVFANFLFALVAAHGHQKFHSGSHLPTTMSVRHVLTLRVVWGAPRVVDKVSRFALTIEEIPHPHRMVDLLPLVAHCSKAPNRVSGRPIREPASTHKPLSCAICDQLL